MGNDSSQHVSVTTGHYWVHVISFRSQKHLDEQGVIRETMAYTKNDQRINYEEERHPRAITRRASSWRWRVSAGTGKARMGARRSIYAGSGAHASGRAA